MTIRRYRRLPTEIEALRWTGNNFPEVEQWCGDHAKANLLRLRLFVSANCAWVDLEPGEWIARDRHGFYPIKDDVFIETYEEVS